MQKSKFKTLIFIMFVIAAIPLVFSGCGDAITIDISEGPEYTPAEVIPEEADINITPQGAPPIGSYMQFGKYQVESENPAPIIWRVIENKSHYKENNPDAKHITLLSEYVIDTRGVDGAEPDSDVGFRAKYGNNRYVYSNIKQWLNSDKKADEWWEPQHDTDAPPIDENFESGKETGYNDKDGFLNSFSSDELSVVMDTKIVCGIDKSHDGGGTEISTDKFFLLSLTEVGLSDKESKYYFEGNPFTVFSDWDSRKATVAESYYENTNSLRIPSDLEQTWDWWLRSPYSWAEYDTWFIDENGTEQHRRAYIDYIGLRPAVNIKYEGLAFTGSGTIDDPLIINF